MVDINQHQNTAHPHKEEDQPAGEDQLAEAEAICQSRDINCKENGLAAPNGLCIDDSPPSKTRKKK